jgi:hypothetical protein
MGRLLRYYLDGRRFEWVITIAMLWLAVEIFISPEALRASAFQWVVLVFPADVIGEALFFIGWTRVIGLLLNGHTFRGVKIGPIIRSSTAIACAVVWVQFDLALLELSARQGFMSPGIPFWSMFIIGELDVAYRAVSGDGRSS